MRLEPHPYLAFLKPVKKSRSGLPQKLLIDSLISTPELLRYVARILPTFLESNRTSIHQPLVGFHFATFLGIFKTLAAQSAVHESFPQPVLASILPSILEGLKTPIIDIKLTTYILVTKLALSSVLDSKLLKNLIQSLIDNYEQYPVVNDNAKAELGWREHDEAFLKALIILFQCNHSDKIPRLSSKSCQTLAAIPNSSNLFMHLSQTVEMSTFWSAFVQGLASSALKQDSAAAEILYKFSQMYLSPTPALHAMIRILLTTAASLETPPPTLLRPLGIISQRHSDVVETIAKELIEHSDIKLHEPIENLLRLACGGIGLISLEGESDVLELSSSSAILRHSALRRILEKLSSKSPSESDEIVTSAIKTALRDPDPIVVQVLFAHPDAINKSISPDEILSAALSFLASSKPPRASCASWMSFLTGPFLSSHPNVAGHVAEDVILDRLFWTKSHAKATAVIWASGLSQSHEAWRGTLLHGIHKGAITSEDPADRMAANEVLFDIVTNSAIKLGDTAITKLIQKLESKYNPTSPLNRLVPMMILRRAVPRLSQNNLCHLINAIVDHVLQSVDRDGFERWVNLLIEETPETADTIKNNFYAKSGSDKVFNRLAGDTLLKALARIHRPPELAYCWFETAQVPSKSSSRPVGGSYLHSHIINLHFKMFSLGHAGGANAKSNSLGRMVLVTLLRDLLGEESLVFLARLWTLPSYTTSLRVMALLDAAAEIEAAAIQLKKTNNGRSKNFQLLMPSLIIALTDPIKSVRSAALEVVKSIRKTISESAADQQTSVATETDIYAYDRFYGPRASTDLQYLSINDSNELIKAIYEFKEGILVDGLSQVQFLLKNISTDRALNPSPADSNKTTSGETGKKPNDNALKRKVLCFFMRVVNCWLDCQDRVMLLRCFTDVTDPLRMYYVAPLIQQICQGTGIQHSRDNKIVSSTLSQYASLLMEAYTSPSKSFKSGKDSASYKVFVEALECSGTTKIQRVLATAAVERLEQSLFRDLSPSHKEDILLRVLAIAVSNSDNAALYVACLRNLPIETSTYTRVLSSLVAQIATKPIASHKKAKTSTGAVGSTIDGGSDLSAVSLFLEMVSVDKLDRSFDLFAMLLETLRVLLATHTANRSDISFSAQLIITGMLTTVTKLTTEEFKVDGIQLNSIVDYMRISVDPHVSQQAILLMAELARLCPDQTCQSMMPIFTFVGTHVIQRDDTFSARVVDKAIGALIPPIVESVRSKGTTRVQLIIHLRELLMMFVGARNHIPKHRRTRLFVRLIEVLGPYHFLGGVMMLLLEADADEPAGSSDLALSVWESFPGQICVAALAHLGAEIETLLDQSNTEETSILSPKPNPDMMVEDGIQEVSMTNSADNTRRAEMLMRFINQALSSKSMQSKLNAARSSQDTDADQVLAFFMIQLLEISQPYPVLTNDQQAQEGRAIAQKVAKLVALPFFARVLLPKLKDDKDRLVSCALDLLRTRLPLIKPAHRPDIEECVKAALSTCANRISIGITSPSEAELPLPLAYAIDILGDITLNSTSSEQSTLSQLYEPLLVMLGSCQDGRLSCAVLSVLSQLVTTLGPRLLPYIQLSINTCATLVKSVLTAESTQHAVVQKAFELMQVTVQNSASFILPYLTTIVKILTDREINQALAQSSLSTIRVARDSLLRTLTKVIPLEELDKTLINMWPSMNVCSEVMLVLLDLLMRAIKHAKVPIAIKESKPIFNFLLLVFDLRRSHAKAFPGPSLANIETVASSVFLSLVLKLNDTTLKPLLLRLIDWAAMDGLEDTANSQIHSTVLQKSIPMYRVFATFLEQLQALGVPYYSHLLDHTAKLLSAFADGEIIGDELWFQVARVLESALQYDQDGFWNATRLSKMTRPIINQLRLANKIDDAQFGPQLQRVLRKLSKKISEHDTLLKILSSGILEELRSAEDVKVRLVGLGALEEIWGEIGSVLVGFVPEMVGGYLVEAMEDDEGGVDLAAKRVVKLIEEELGEGIDGYLA
ncbi:hypothetical protein CROQUDRAFT_45903 [Cronartium quercuum f. sp. fusiforme G11]|uniref:U3 small nucleolar RNA-associated protein 10 n=1 Tax=Cronartium quercuum f. sp. fusiforme G11 TaxID=708437 RepID=A0A9P6TB63_9BASI|nr:hypothetical protein CROQUDRAFT_45903 [Cronartium quercuum f. sp. fusiforme G11]